MNIFEDVMEYNEEYQLKTLLELLKNNTMFVNNFVTDEFVSFLAQTMIRTETDHEFKEIKYLEVFRAFCICGKEVNSNNQVLILNNFIQQLPSENRGFKYKIAIEKRKVENEDGKQEIFVEAAVDKNVSKFRPFIDHYKICKEEYPTAWKYFVCFLNLIADMVQGRNKTVEGYIEGMITSDVLSSLLEEKEIYEAEVPVIRLMHYLYAES